MCVLEAAKGYLIRMAPEVGEWLAAVRDRDPAVADLIDEAVAAWYTEAIANCRIRYQREQRSTS